MPLKIMERYECILDILIKMFIWGGKFLKWNQIEMDSLLCVTLNFVVSKLFTIKKNNFIFSI